MAKAPEGHARGSSTMNQGTNKKERAVDMLSNVTVQGMMRALFKGAQSIDDVGVSG